MSSSKHLDSLRKQNKELLQKLKNETENLQRLHLECCREQINSETSKSEDWRPAKRSARDPTPLNEKNEGSLIVSGSSEMPPGCSTGEDLKHLPETMLESASLQDGSQRVMGRVRFISEEDEWQSVSEAERRRVQPLLGYDWIAGLLDAESSLTERSEQFFNELQSFRQVNREECVHSISPGLSDATTTLCPPAVGDDVTNHKGAPESHQCTFCYRINSRLFATPLDPQTACPVCRMPKEQHPHTESQPALIRVSIPRTTLLPAHRYKARRRCSFDPSDSLGLPSHCLSGWTNNSVGARFKMSSLDLRSSMEIGSNAGTVQNENQLDLSRSWASGHQSKEWLPDVSRLPRYQFQHGATTRTKPFY